MKTWGEMRTEIEAETNTGGEDFVADTELLAWANDAKTEAEAEIVSLYDPYLETEDYLALAIGEDSYDLPADIYASKITGIYFNDGSESYEITLMKRKSTILNVNDNARYQYRIVNTTADGVQLKLYPASRETSSTNVTIHYIRRSAPITDDNSLMDIPLADAFIKQYVKDKIRGKELGPLAEESRSQLLEKQKQLLIEALNQMIPDENSDQIDPDLTFYDAIEYDVWGDY
jgi:hypothetical protein